MQGNILPNSKNPTGSLSGAKRVVKPNGIQHGRGQAWFIDIK